MGWPDERLIRRDARAQSLRGPTVAVGAISDLTGKNERKLDTPVDGSDPAWGPLRPEAGSGQKAD